MPELIETINQISGGPNGITVAGQRPEYLPNRQNGKHGWVFSSGNHHIKLAAASPDFDVNGCEITICGKRSSTPADNEFERLWALGDKLYLVVYPDGKIEVYRRYSISDARYQSVNPVIFDDVPFLIETFIDASAPSTAPTLRNLGTEIQMTRLGDVGQGTPQSTAGMAFHIGNREANDAGTSFLDRGWSGDIYDWATIDQFSSPANRTIVRTEMATSWGLTVANPDDPSIENQSFSIQKTATAGAVVGTVQAQNAGTTPVFSITGNAALLFDIASATGTLSLKAGVALPEIGSSIGGTVSINNGVGNASATITVAVVANTASSLRWPRPSWINNITRVETPTSGSGTLNYRPDFDGQDILIDGPSDTVTRGAFGIEPRTVQGSEYHFRNVAIIRGHYVGTDNAGSGKDAVWRVKSLRGTFWAEGLRMRGGYRQDGFQIATNGSGLLGNWYFQRIWWDDITGERPSPHGDYIQPLGPVDTVFVDMIWGESEYQGFFMDTPNNSGARVKRFVLGNANLRHFNDRNVGGAQVWVDRSMENGCLIGDPNSPDINPVWLTKHNNAEPPNRFFEPKESDVATWNGSDLVTINYTRSNGARLEGYMNVGEQPGGDLLVNGPNPGKNFVRRGTNEIYGGLDYPSAA